MPFFKCNDTFLLQTLDSFLKSSSIKQESYVFSITKLPYIQTYMSFKAFVDAHDLIMHAHTSEIVDLRVDHPGLYHVWRRKDGCMDSLSDNEVDWNLKVSILKILLHLFPLLSLSSSYLYGAVQHLFNGVDDPRPCPLIRTEKFVHTGWPKFQHWSITKLCTIEPKLVASIQITD